MGGPAELTLNEPLLAEEIVSLLVLLRGELMWMLVLLLLSYALSPSIGGEKGEDKPELGDENEGVEEEEEVEEERIESFDASSESVEEVTVVGAEA